MGPVFEVALDRALPTFKRFRKSVCRANNQQGGSVIHHGQQEAAAIIPETVGEAQFEAVCAATAP